MQTIAKLRDMNIATCNDDQGIEVLASGLPCFQGSQLAIDVTLRSSLDQNGDAKGQSHWKNSFTLDEARKDKESTYPELHSGNRCRLVALGLDVNGRMSAETVDFLERLARARARTVLYFFQKAASLAYRRRWSRMLAVLAASSVAALLLLSKVELRNSPVDDGNAPWLLDVLAETRLG